MTLNHDYITNNDTPYFQFGWNVQDKYNENQKKTKKEKLHIMTSNILNPSVVFCNLMSSDCLLYLTPILHGLCDILHGLCDILHVLCDIYHMDYYVIYYMYYVIYYMDYVIYYMHYMIYYM